MMLIRTNSRIIYSSKRQFKMKNGHAAHVGAGFARPLSAEPYVSIQNKASFLIAELA